MYCALGYQQFIYGARLCGSFQLYGTLMFCLFSEGSSVLPLVAAGEVPASNVV
jgi:hypothetical protein